MTQLLSPHSVLSEDWLEEENDGEAGPENKNKRQQQQQQQQDEEEEDQNEAPLVTELGQLPKAVRDILSHLDRQHRKREKFCENLISLRKSLPFDCFDIRHAGIMIPCYDEGTNIDASVSCIVDELPHITALCPEIKKLTAMFIVDGCETEQLRTSVAVLECFIRKLSCPDSFDDEVVEDLSYARDFFARLCMDEEEIHDMKGILALQEDPREREELTRFITAYAERKWALFDDPLVNAQYPDYSSKLFQYAFDVYPRQQQQQLSPCLEEASQPMLLQVVLLVKEENKMKRDSLLVAFYRFLSFPDVPFLTAFLDADTSFKSGSYARMFNTILNTEDCAGTSGFLKVRNASWKEPLGCVQDFSWLVAQTFQKEAENFLGAVTCLPGAFSAGQTLALTDVAVLEQITALPSNLIAKNMLELGEDRFVTTMLLTRRSQSDASDDNSNRHNSGHGNVSTTKDGKQQPQEPQRRIYHLSSAVSYSDAPSDVISLMLQQRRWINSTLCNSVFGLLPYFMSSLVSSLLLSSRGDGRPLGGTLRFLLVTVWLMLRTVFEALLFFFSPSLVGAFAYAVMVDVQVPWEVSVGAVAAFFGCCVALTIVFPNPKHFPWLYKIFLTGTSLASLGLVIYWLEHMLQGYFTRTLTDYNAGNGSELFRFAFVILLAFSTLFIATCHGFLVEYFNPLWKPLLYLGFSFSFYMLVPCFSFYNLSSFGWGTKAANSRLGNSAAEARAADRATRYFFLLFLLGNGGLLYVIFMAGSSNWNAETIFTIVILSLISTGVFFSFILSLLSACKKWYRFFVPVPLAPWRKPFREAEDQHQHQHQHQQQGPREHPHAGDDSPSGNDDGDVIDRVDMLPAVGGAAEPTHLDEDSFGGSRDRTEEKEMFECDYCTDVLMLDWPTRSQSMLLVERPTPTLLA